MRFSFCEIKMENLKKLTSETINRVRVIRVIASVVTNVELVYHWLVWW